MSMFSPVSLECSKCGTPILFEAVNSVNADRRPDLRAAIIEGIFQRQACPNCAAPLRLEPEFVYLDVARRHWILVRPSGHLAEWLTLEQAAQSIFDAAFGAESPNLVREIGQSIRVRVTFGWPALQEKLLCSELDLDDMILELVKIAVLRTQDRLLLGDTTECRLIGRTDQNLVFGWLDAATEETIEIMDVPRSVYDGIAADLIAWQAVRAEFAERPFVDLHRLLVPTTSTDGRVRADG